VDIKKIIILLTLTISFSYCDQVDITLFSEVKNQINSIFSTYGSIFRNNALGLLVALGVIQIVITFGFMGMRGELEIGGAFAQLVKTALVIGFFSMLISSPSWFIKIHNAFDNLGIAAAGSGANLDDFMNNIGKMWEAVLKQVEENGAIGVGNSILQILAAFFVTIPLIFMAGQALMYYAFSVVSVYVGILWLGFGSFDQTRPWAINAIANVIRWNAKWMLQMMMIALAFSFVSNLSTMIGSAPTFEHILSLAITILLLFSINSGISGFVDSYFTGSGGGENNRGMQMATAMAAGVTGAAMGAYQGAKGASDTIAAAKATGEEKSTLGKVGSYLGGMVSGATKGAIHGGENFATNWSKTIDPNYSSASSLSSGKNFASAANEQKVAQSDGDVGGATKGSFAEPKVGGEINPNQSDKS